ncbi:hypothetical protein [Gimesia algae]|uniref:DoxX n=1 Tax=Gimesia algae TaxID=2527971 RepID=A0A517VAD3_9PLAN|nr:hypothetical protein [Gimesia algae]QDT89955.1 hypothetical protein Pan161_15880 [Gimesia algae]
MSEPTPRAKHVRHPKLATPARFLFALFLVSTGLMTMMFGVQGYPLPDDPSPFSDFMKALDDTGYIIFWVGLVKFIAGSLLFARRTTPLALLIALPYTVNILLYCIFIANQYLLLGIPDFLCNAFLIYAWFDWYKGCFED